jgi:hypothetical protein
MTIFANVIALLSLASVAKDEENRGNMKTFLHIGDQQKHAAISSI